MTNIWSMRAIGWPVMHARAAVVLAFLTLLAAPASAITLGNTGIGVVDDGDSNYLNGSKVAVGSSNLQVTSMSVYVGAVDTAPNNQFQVGIYTDSNGSPGTLVVASVAAALTPNAWNTVSMSAALQANANYWLIYNTNGRTGAVNNMYYSSGSSGQGAYSRASVGFGTLPASFGSSTLTTALYSLYVTAASGSTVTPGASPTPTATGTDPRSSVGEWSALMNWPIVAMHANLLKNGKVLVWDEEDTVTQPKVWDPATLAFTNTPLVNDELWCAGQTQLADGQLLVAGGHTPHVGEVGISSTYQYLPDTNTWLTTSDMLYDRWYPTLTRLGDGRVVIMTGQITTDVFADIPEMYDPATGSSTALTSIATPQLHEEEYPANFHLPTGKVLCISPQYGPVQLFDAGATTWTNVTTTPIRFGSAVQYRPGQILMSGGGSAFLVQAVKQAAVLDMNAPTPAWRSTNSMTFGRYMHNLVMLPTGDVLAVGGSTPVNQQASSGPLAVELWNPGSEAWTTLAAMQVPRMYHSTALLLPDGRLLAAGGGHNGAAPNQFSAQLYSPPYLFKGARPSIASAPATVAYGASTFVVDTPDAPNISSVSLIALGAVTHSNDMNQLYTEPSFTNTAGQLVISAPANSAQVPPGYYMLFIVDSNRVPSVAKIVKVGGVSPPTPSPTTTPPPLPPSPTRTLPPPSATASATVAGPSPSATASATVAGPSPSATASATVGTPPPSTVVLGNTAIGVADDGDSNYLNGSRVAVGATSVQVTSMSAYVGAVDTSPNNQYQVAIYTDNNGAPGTLVAGTLPATLTPNAWNTAVISAALQANTNYWLVYNTNGRTAALNNMYYSPGTPGQGAFSRSSVAFGTWPASFGSATLTTSIYALYATGSSGSTVTPSATVAGPSPSATVGAPSPSATVGAPSPSATASATRTLPPPSATASATLPVPSPSPSPPSTTLGLTAIGSILDSGDSNFLNGSRVLTTSGGQIASMSVYVGATDSNSNNRSYQMAIYTDSAGRPGTLVAATAAGTLIANSWNTLPITATLQPATNYWLMYNANGGTGAVNNMRYNSGTVGQGAYSAKKVNFGTWPTTFPASSLSDAVYSLYATFGP